MSSTLTRPPPEASPRQRPASPHGAAPTASGRYPGLDGLRAIAIVAVLVFHAHPAWLPGGFLGVDVFFVISGFLITSLLVRERERAGRIDFRAFWTRRARRLLPAMAVVVVVSSLVARAVSPELVVALPRQVLGAATFSTNWVEILAGGSYFDQTAPTLFMNFWSLAVEEQFYLVWPLATLALLTWAGGRVRVAIPAVVAAASAAAMAALYAPGRDNTRAYYGTDTHLMGLMIGAALAFAWASDLRGRLAGWVGGRRWSGPAALATLAVLMRLLSEDSPLTFYGGFALASVVTGVLLIATLNRVDASGRPHRTPWQRVLDAPAASWVGERSYGLYLWHWPVILIVDGAWPTAPGTWPFVGRTVLAVLLTGVLAQASYRFVETPVRRAGFRATGRRVLAWARGLPAMRLRALAASVLVMAVAFAAVLVTAPAESATARVLRENAAAEASDSAGVGAAGADGEASAGSGASAAPVAAIGTWGMPTGAEIDGFGDSIMVGCIPALKLYFPGVRLDAVSNRRIADGIAAVKTQAGVRRGVVVDFGMNAGVNAVALRELLDLLGPDRMVVVVNLYGTFSRIDADNAAIASAVAGRGNVIVADWYTTAKNNPASLQSDRKHPSLRGSHLYAQTVQAAFAELSKRHTGQEVTLKTYPLPAH